MANIVAIVGRPNVGKSTLFNRLTGTRRAIVIDEPGATRDRQYGKVEWCGSEFSIIDTGGLLVDSEDTFEKQIRSQVDSAMREADVVLFLTDVREGMTGVDVDVANSLRKSPKPVILAVNKVDEFSLQYGAYDFYRLGFGDPVIVSAENGLGTGELLDKICSYFNKSKEQEEEVDVLPRMAIVGRPNVGKSSMLNAFIGEERAIVTDIAGTTRDSIYTKYDKFGKRFYLVDTAGIRKKSRVEKDIEYFSIVRSIRAIENSDVCLLLLDATRGIEAQDVSIFSLIRKNRKGLVVCVNKWDIAEDKSTEGIKFFERAIRERTSPFTDFPIIFCSALTKHRIFKVVEKVMEVYENIHRKIPTAELNERFLPLIKTTPPPFIKGKEVKIKYCTQLPDTRIPTFVFFANLPQYVKEPYLRFLENHLRQWWSLTGVPVQIFIRAK